MKVAFAGTPEFAAVALRALIAAGFEIVLVLTQPDRPAGRGQKLVVSPVKQVALAAGIPVHQPERLKAPATHAPLIEAAPDLLVVAAYGLILPQAVLDIPRRGCLNIHASLLPRWRGAAPIQRCIEAGDAETGVTIMQMEAGLDTGPMLLAHSLRVGAGPSQDDAPPVGGSEPGLRARGANSVGAGETAASLHDKLAILGSRLIVLALREFESLKAVVQPAAGVTYANKIAKAEAAIDWRLPAALIERRIRAFDPFPGATAQLGDSLIKVWRALPENGAGTPGTIIAVSPSGITVACGVGALKLVELQKPGGRRLASADFLHGFPLAVGQAFALPAAQSGAAGPLGG
ncbi:MAG: methionyl-tRNA formyltransferase [Rhodocyclaceae bacterium]|nr:methionyl-tRNA formyltransferase [Rhodocyclaceae bacterium]